MTDLFGIKIKEVLQSPMLIIYNYKLCMRINEIILSMRKTSPNSPYPLFHHPARQNRKWGKVVKFSTKY